YIHRLLLPDCLVDLLFRENSSRLTGKVRQGVKFICFRQRKHAPLIRNLVLVWIYAKTRIVKNLITPYRWILCIEFRQDLFCHLSSWIRGAEDNLHLFHPLPPISNIICIFLKVIYISFFFVLNTLSRSIEQTKIT